MVIATTLNDPLASTGERESRLTRQEQDILARTASGWSAVSVAEDLGLTLATVHWSLASIIERVGARSKIEAAMIAVREGLIDLPEDPIYVGEAATEYRASATRPVARLRSWAASDRPDARRPLTFEGARHRVIELRRSQFAEVDGAAT